jgi:uncharacterized membrane protein
MTHQQAVSVVPAPLEVVERRLRDVGGWSQFLVGVERVVGTSFGRYTFTVKDGTKTRAVEVAVVAHPGEHRIVWHALAGPRFDGEVRLTPIDARHTRVSLSLVADPAGFLAALSDFIRSPQTAAVLDLQRLEAMVTASRT